MGSEALITLGVLKQNGEVKKSRFRDSSVKLFKDIVHFPGQYVYMSLTLPLSICGYDRASKFVRNRSSLLKVDECKGIRPRLSHIKQIHYWLLLQNPWTSWLRRFPHYG